MATAADPSSKRASGMDEYKQHLSVATTRHVRRRRSWADQDMAYASLPHGKTYAVLAAEGIVVRARQELEKESPGSIMSIIVRPVSDAELHRACIIEAAAYADSDLTPILFPGPFPPDSQQRRVDQLVQMREDDPTAVYLQAIDTASGRMIASAKWHVYKTPEEASLPIRKLEFGAGTNREACMAFFGGMIERKKEILGDRPHLYLHMLHTDPEYQGRGAGSALMEWGKQKADELGLPIYLESSTKGHRFYKKHGFEDVEVLSVDFGPYGGPVHEQPLMMRKVNTHA